MGNGSTSLTAAAADSSDEPNLVIYNLIKEIDYIIESNNFYKA